MQSIESQYLSAIQEIIDKQIILLGKQIAIKKCSNISGLYINNNGKIKKISSDPHKILQKLVSSYFRLSGLVFKAHIEPILNKYPDLPIYVS